MSASLTPQSDELEERGDTLQDGRETPRPLAGPEVGSEADPSSSDGANVPETVVHSGEPSTVLGVSKLRNKHGRRHLRETVSETNEDTTDKES
jgi:hypothetical protein